ncbi:zinc ribbon domain-containing protein [Ruminococcus sp.]|uniref:zinc ribbon domain-containing protein n=1 Tax=Ruminococcus sp. TaxID=41978 RepID=UPI0038700E05
MNNCPRCNAQLEDNAAFCPNCGFSVAQQAATQPQQAQPNPQEQQYNQYAAAPVANPTDHTAEFSAEEVSENKLIAALIYVSGILGVIVALIAQSSRKSKYLDFHIKQGLMITIIMFFLAVAGAILSFTCIVPIAAAICEVILLVCQYICLFKTLANKSVEVPIINKFGFLK